MDPQRFDEVSRSLSSAFSRRGLLAIVTASLPAVHFVGTRREAVEAKRRRRQRKQKKRKNRSTPNPCTPTCAGKACGDDGCGGACGSCGDGFVCQDGSCRCPPERELCGGACRAVCLPFQARNPASCECCQINLPFACGSDAQCCSGICAGGIACAGRPAGASCTFGAQCLSNECLDGACVS